MTCKVAGYPEIDEEIDWIYWLEKNRQWWPWSVAVAFYEQKTGLRITKEHLMKMGRAGYFRFGQRLANCPSRLAPVERFTFQPWVEGRGPQIKKSRRKS